MQGNYEPTPEQRQLVAEQYGFDMSKGRERAYRRTRTVLANKCGCSPDTIYRFIHGDRACRLTLALALAEHVEGFADAGPPLPSSVDLDPRRAAIAEELRAVPDDRLDAVAGAVRALAA